MTASSNLTVKGRRLSAKKRTIRRDLRRGVGGGDWSVTERIMSTKCKCKNKNDATDHSLSYPQGPYLPHRAAQQ